MTYVLGFILVGSALFLPIAAVVLIREAIIEQRNKRTMNWAQAQRKMWKWRTEEKVAPGPLRTGLVVADHWNS